MSNTPNQTPSSPEPDWVALATDFSEGRQPTDPFGAESHLQQTVRRAWEVVGPGPTPELDRVALWQQISAKTRNSAAQSKVPQHTLNAKRTPVRRFGGWATAAIAVAAVIAAAGVWGSRISTPATTKPSAVYATLRGETRQISLPDGSTIVLAPDSRISFDEGAEPGGRRVRLTGQAYFTVTHDAARPFTVQSAGVRMRVLGTAFDVRAYPSDTAAHVVVAEGKVAVERNSSSVVLSQGEAAIVASDAQTTVLRNYPVAQSIGWMQGILDVRDVPLRDLVRDLERMYDLDIHIADSALANRPVTVVLSSRSVSDMLNTIAPIVDAKFSLQNKFVVLMPNASF